MSNKPIRILQVLGGLNIGGAETLVMNIYRCIDRSKIQFDFVVHGKKIGFYESEIHKFGGKIYRVPRYNIINHFSYKRKWNDLISAHSEYKIIHSHVRSTASIILRIAKKYGLITICHSHSTSNGKGLSSIVKNILQKSIPKYADYLFACSKESAMWLYGSKYASANNCIILNNAIDSSKYIYNSEIREKVRKILKLEDKIILGQVGRLTEVKNHTFTVNILKELVKKNKKYCLLIIGSGPLKESILSQIKEYNLEQNVILLENRSDVNELLQAIDIYLMPSLWEGLPLALVEAQAASLPCLISNNISDGILINELVHKEQLDTSIWIKKILELSTIRANRKNVCKEIIKSGFDIKDNSEILSNFYINLLNKE